MRSIFVPLAVIGVIVCCNSIGAKAEEPLTTGSIAGASAGTSTGLSRYVCPKASFDTPSLLRPLHRGCGASYQTRQLLQLAGLRV